MGTIIGVCSDFIQIFLLRFPALSIQINDCMLICATVCTYIGGVHIQHTSYTIRKSAQINACHNVYKTCNLVVLWHLLTVIRQKIKGITIGQEITNTHLLLQKTQNTDSLHLHHIFILNSLQRISGSIDSTPTVLTKQTPFLCRRQECLMVLIIYFHCLRYYCTQGTLTLRSRNADCYL